MAVDVVGESAHVLGQVLFRHLGEVSGRRRLMGYLRAYGPMRSEEQMALRRSSVLAPRSPDGLPRLPRD